MKTLKVEIPRNKVCYPVFIGRGILKKIDLLVDLKPHSGLVVVSDENVVSPWAKLVKQKLIKRVPNFKLIPVPQGESSKSLKQLAWLYQELIRGGFDRKTLILALGGGVMGDLGGFLAATFLRGVDFILIPTTLLAQVDAAVGGKVGINFGGLKNVIGSFYQPKAVIIDVETLATLPKRQLKSGIAEIVKYGLCLDKNLLSLLMNKRVSDLNNQDLLRIVKWCIKLKAEVVERDEKDLNIRAVLNFGHTIAHAIEANTNIFTHGEAVAVGMMGAAKISRALGFLSSKQVQKIKEVLSLFGLPLSYPALSSKVLWQKMTRDKKSKNKKLGWVLLKTIGEALINQEVKQEIVFKILKELNNENFSR